LILFSSLSFESLSQGCARQFLPSSLLCSLFSKNSILLGYKIKNFFRNNQIFLKNFFPLFRPTFSMNFLIFIPNRDYKIKNFFSNIQILFLFPSPKIQISPFRDYYKRTFLILL